MSDRLNLLLSMLEENQVDTFILFALAKEYENIGDDEQAESMYVKLKEVDADYVGLYYHLGKLHERQGRIPTAFAIYKEGGEVAKRLGDSHSLSELMGAKLNLGDDEDFE